MAKKLGRGLKWMFGALALLLVLVTCTPIGELVAITALNQITTSEFRVAGDRLYMSGDINSKTLVQFNKVYAANPNITQIVEMDMPGSIDDDTMIKLAYRVRALGLNTHLTATSEIYSGGVDLFLAGVERTMETGAIIGVHSWSDGFRDAADYPRDAPEHEQNRKYIEDMLGQDDFYWFTIYAAPGGGIYEMNAAEVTQYGLLTDVPI